MATTDPTRDRYQFYQTDIYNRLSEFEGSIRNLLTFTGNTPCGPIQFTPTYKIEGEGAPDLGYRMVHYYYQTLCDFCYSIPRSPEWIVFIAPQNRQYLVSEIGNLRKYEPATNGNDWKLGGAPDKLTSREAQDIIGCIFSHGVTIPGETITIAQTGVNAERTQGFLKGPITTAREDLQQLQVVFKETNCSYTDLFIRPWSILLGHKGLHARPQSESIKANIVIYQMARIGEGQKPVIRKAFQFYDAAPVSVNAEDKDYDGDQLVQRQVSFTYNTYSVWDGTEFGQDATLGGGAGEGLPAL
jgi:hypothetical protein